MSSDEYSSPDGLSYSKEHEWAKDLGSGKILVGITDYAVKMLGDVVFVQLPDEGSEVRFMEPMGSIESIKAVSDLYSPITGKVTKVNKALSEHPETVASSPYSDGWLIEVEAQNASEELGKLMKPEEYRAYIGQLSQGG